MVCSFLRNHRCIPTSKMFRGKADSFTKKSVSSKTKRVIGCYASHCHGSLSVWSKVEKFSISSTGKDPRVK